MAEPRQADGAEPLWLPALDQVTGAMRSLAAALDGEPDERELLQQICEHAVRAVPGVESASVTVVRDDSASTAAGTDDMCATLDLAQYRAGAGPCLEAAETGTLVRTVIDDDAPRRWPAFAAAARDAGMGGVLSAPLALDQTAAGSINCYRSDGAGFADLDARLLELYVSSVETALHNVSRYQRARDLAEQMRQAMSSRAVIDQAKGILMAVRGLSADEAFAVLVDQASNRNVKLRVLAQRLVDESFRHGGKR
jgi:hypothetical protein